ncbi:MAG: hypothetical protein IKP68_09715, partial [Clostridia bacterium]|nr:hypothetical protein [Clostridia bacterium]
METQVIGKVEDDMVSKLETSISFGKSFDKYYGIEDIFEAFSAQYEGPVPFIINKDGELLYAAESDDGKNIKKIAGFIDSGEFKLALPDLVKKEGKPVISEDEYAVFSPIHDGEELVGYFGCLYEKDIFSDSFSDIKSKAIKICIVLMLIELVAILAFASVVRSEKWLTETRLKRKRRTERLVSAIIVGGGILILSGISLNMYQNDYRNRIEQSVEMSLGGLEKTVSRVGEQGVDLREVEDLEQYLSDKAKSLNFIKRIGLSSDISDVKGDKDYITFELKSGGEEGKPLYLEAKISV